jgi:hypothetical protein
VRLDHLLSKEPLATRSTGITPAVAEAPGRSSAPDTLFSFEGATLEHLENSIASASIYKKSSEQGLTVDALAPGAEEGRVRLRKASGSCRESIDPRMSEWGNPAGVMPGHPSLNT